MLLADFLNSIWGSLVLLVLGFLFMGKVVYDRWPEPQESEPRGVTGASTSQVHVSFSAEVYKVLEEIAEKRGISVADVIEEAIGLEQSYQKTLEEGGRMIIEHKDGHVWELKREHNG